MNGVKSVRGGRIIFFLSVSPFYMSKTIFIERFTFPVNVTLPRLKFAHIWKHFYSEFLKSAVTVAAGVVIEAIVKRAIFIGFL